MARAGRFCWARFFAVQHRFLWRRSAHRTGLPGFFATSRFWWDSLGLWPAPGVFVWHGSMARFGVRLAVPRSGVRRQADRMVFRAARGYASDYGDCCLSGVAFVSRACGIRYRDWLRRSVYRCLGIRVGFRSLLFSFWPFRSPEARFSAQPERTRGPPKRHDVTKRVANRWRSPWTPVDFM